MIKGIMIINNHGKVRLARFYNHIDQNKQQRIVREIFTIVSKRSDAVCNFVEISKSWEERYSSDNKITAVIESTEETKTDEVQKKMIEEREMKDFFDSKLIYRHYATLFFIFLVDQSESELGILDLIQVFVEALDQRFENVCELDIVFHYDEVNYILDEIVMAGMVLETKLNEIMSAVHGAKKYEKISKKAAKQAKTVLKSHIVG
mmetsp:Transcript_97959/g.119980  ORF Transcript_97959/g.119980 Transcript_97959/m.119980 type:complete len:205 (+) Transcript_97959:90-704(+)